MPAWRSGAALLLTLLCGPRVGVAKPLHHSAPSNLDMSGRHLSFLIRKEMVCSGQLASCVSATVGALQAAGC